MSCRRRKKRKAAQELEDMIISGAANQDSTTTAAGSEVSQHSSGRESHVKKQARLESEWQSHTSHMHPQQKLGNAVKEH